MSRTSTIAADLAKLLGESTAPVYLLDEDRQIIYCNPACARWVGIRSVDLIGQHCAYHSAVDATGAARAASGLCPPPKAFSGQAVAATVCRIRPDGTMHYRLGHFFALADGQDESAPVLAVLAAEDCAEASSNAPISTDAALHDQVRQFRRQAAGRFQLDGLLGHSPSILRARAQVKLAAESRVNVLIVGPTGAGKHHAAKVIHYAGAEPGTLVPLACAVLEPNLLRSTLRAFSARSAATGTLLAADVDLLPPDVQADLAEILRSPSLQMRVISTTVKPLADLVARGQFSHDLACLLDTITIDLPPLASRLKDLPVLAQAFLEQLNGQGGKQVGGFSSEALDHLAVYPWPGNVDELAAVVRGAHQQAQGGEVAVRDLPHEVRMASQAASRSSRADETIELEQFLANVETELIERALRRAKGNKSKAARLLGLTRPRLYRRLVQLGLEQPNGEPEE